jgi:2-polyprenyl-6-methoxyphenol hydroxylase-like FAD-dependent oxidoreductase
MTANPPVLVVGGGPVGMAAALLLARFQVPTIVLEAKPAREAVGSKSICVQRDVLDIYHRIGVADALMAEGVTWQRGRTFYRDHELFTTTFPDPGRSAYPGFINIPQSSVERALEAAVHAQPLVALRYEHQVVALRQNEEQVTVRVRAPTGQLDLAGSHLIAADGSRSTVRSLLGLHFDGESFDDLFLIADIRAELPFGAERRFHFDPSWNPERQVLVHPQPDSVWRIDWQVPANFDLAADEASGLLDERIRSIVGEAAYDVVWLSVYRFQQRLASRMRVSRVLLAGDAAHLMAPFGARGLNSGVQDAENAAWKVALDRAGRGGTELLASYEQERVAAARENLRVTGETMRFLVPRDEAEWDRRRHLLEQAVVEPSARSAVDSGKLAEPFWYLDSPLTTGRPPADFPVGAGQARPSVAGVLCPDGPVTVPSSPSVTRLRELFGAGPVVLACGVEVDVPVGVQAYRLDQIDHEGIVSTALCATPGWCAVVRPDGHLAAVLHYPDPVVLGMALDRARGAVPTGTTSPDQFRPSPDREIRRHSGVDV